MLIEDRSLIRSIDSSCHTYVVHLNRHFYVTLNQAVMTTMVTLPEAHDRTKALKAWQNLMDSIDVPCRLSSIYKEYVNAHTSDIYIYISDDPRGDEYIS